MRGPAAVLWVAAVAVACATGSPLTLDDVAGRLAFLKDYFKVHLYVNPHPACALQAESCTLDNNCCGGLECRMTAGVDAGIGSVCRPKVGGGGDVYGEEDPDPDEVNWNFDLGAGDGSDSGTTAEEAQRERVRLARQKEQALADTNNQVIQELRRPLSLEEMTSLRQRQEADELRRDQELRQLTQWKKDKDEGDREKEREVGRIEALAKDRVDRVLEEEDKQKMDMLHKMQAAIKTTNGDDKQQ